MKQFFIQVLIGLPFVVLGSIYGPQLLPFAHVIPYLMIVFLWLALILSLILARPRSFRKIGPGIVLSTAVCVPMMVSLFNLWAALAMAAVFFLIGNRWGAQWFGQVLGGGEDPKP
jgi:hypothetical protein